MNQNYLPLLILGIPASGLLLRAVLALIYGARGPKGGYSWLYFNGRGLGTFIFVGSIVFMLLPATFFLGGALLLFGGFALIEWLQARRDLQRQAIWSVLVNSQQKNRPLNETLAMHSPRFTGLVGRSYKKLMYTLGRGASLPDAIDLCPTCLPKSALATVALYGDATLPTDPRLAGNMPLNVTNLWSRIYFFFSYMLCTSLYGMVILTFVMVAIIPAFEAIFSDFGLKIPALTTILIASSDLFVSTGLGTVIWGCLLMGFFFILAVFVCYLFDFQVLSPFFDRIGWFKHRSQILYLLAESIGRKQSFSDTMNRLTIGRPRYGNRFAVKRLEKAERLASSGNDWIDSLYRARIIRKRDVAPLETASQAGNLTWVLRRISDDILEQAVFRWSVVEKTVLPFLVVLMGVIVAFVVVGLFLPLVSLINNLV